MGLFSIFNRKQSRSWAELTLTGKEFLSDSFVVLTLQKDKECGFDPKFTPGQYVTVEVEQGGKAVRRSYSICGKSSEGFKIGVKRIDGGVMSTHLHRQTNLGDKIKVHVAEGEFTVEDFQKVCVFAAGSGITPMMAMIEAYRHQKEFHVFYNTKTYDELIYREQLKDAKARIYLSQEEREGFKHGRLDYEALMEELKENLTLLQADAYMLCGPEGFMSEIERGLLFFGVPEGKIKKEFFIPPSPAEQEIPVQKSAEQCRITVMLDGQTTVFDASVKKRTLLEVLETAKLDPPYSCRGGVCSSCKAKITEGSAVMRQNFTLTEKEVAGGCILTCQADITSSTISVTFDE